MEKNIQSKIIKITIAFLIFLLIALLSNTTFAAEKSITFKDVNMYNAMVGELGDKIISKDDETLTIKMTQENIDSVTDILAFAKSITDISGIEQFTNITYLHLGANNISDISELVQLKKLKILYLPGNNISSISALRDLNSLEELVLNDNNISDISELRNLISLAELELSNNNINDISALKDLIRLTKLGLYNNYISDISILEGLIELEELVLYDNYIQDWSVLNKLSSLDYERTLFSSQLIFVQANEGEKEIDAPVILQQVKDEGGKLYTADDFTLTNCKLSDDLSIITLNEGVENALIKINGGKLQGTKIFIKVINKDIVTKSITLKNVNDYKTMLNALGTAVVSKDDENLTIKLESGITELKIEEKINDLTILSELKELTSLSISHNNVRDISALANLTNLTRLDLTYNKINDISALAELKQLTSLYLVGNSISDISALRELKELTNLDLYGNNISDMSALENLEKLNYEGYGSYFEGVYLDEQEINLEVLKGTKELDAPPILKQAKEEGSKLYTAEDFTLTNCKLNSDLTKITLNEGVEEASIVINGGKLTDSKITIKVVDKLTKKLERIEITKAPSKTKYNVGENFDSTGMEVTATYSDGTTKVITDYTIVSGENLTEEKKSVVIRYEEENTLVSITQSVEVKGNSVLTKTLEKIEITKAPSKTKYNVGENFDSTGMEVTATYSDGTTKVIINYTVVDGLNLTGEKKQVTISYQEGDKIVTATQAIEVVNPTETPDEPTEEPNEPTEEPDKPTEEPDKPVEEPDDPTEEPDKPTEEPDKPVENPDEPTEEPDKPVEEPDEPTEEPNEPTEDPDEPTETPFEPFKENSKLKVKEYNNVNYLVKISPKTTVKNIQENLETGYTAIFKNEKGEEIKDLNKYVSTGNTKITVTNGKEEMTYTIVVEGDCTGDGKVNAQDLIGAVRQYKYTKSNGLKGKALTGAQLLSIKHTEKEKYTALDLIGQVRMYKEWKNK